MNNSEKYRASAVACGDIAAAVEDTTAKFILLNMAEAWLRLADYAERRERHEEFGAANSPDQNASRKSDSNPDQDKQP